MSEIQIASVVPAARSAARWWAAQWNQSLLQLGEGDLDFMMELMPLVENYHGVTEEQREAFCQALAGLIDAKLSEGNLQISAEFEPDEILLQAARAVPEVVTSPSSFPLMTKMLITCDEVLVKSGDAPSYTELELR